MAIICRWSSTRNSYVIIATQNIFPGPYEFDIGMLGLLYKLSMRRASRHSPVSQL